MAQNQNIPRRLWKIETTHSLKTTALTYWKKKSEELPILAALAKEYLRPTVASAPSDRLFSIAGNFYYATRNLLGKDTFRNLMFIKCNSNMCDKVNL